MLIVGSDRMTVAGATGAPAGTRHAVDREGRVLCRSTRPRFAWPSLAWDDHRDDEAACHLCARVRNAQEAVSQLPGSQLPGSQLPGSPAVMSEFPAYPVETPVPTTAIVPWLPAAGLFEPSDQ